MNDMSRIIRKFERFIGVNYNREVRTDSVGALSDEVSNSRRYYLRKDSLPLIRNSDEIPQAVIFYNFENQTEKIFYFKSRGNPKHLKKY